MQRTDFTKELTIIGLTGSIGMGKTTTANMFQSAGVPVFDSDAMVHRMQAPGGEALPHIEAEFHGVVQKGVLDRLALGELVFKEQKKLERLQNIIYPLLHERRRNFFAHALRKGKDIVLVDVPLLFETGGDQAVDLVIVVDAPLDVQRERVLSRIGMTEEKFQNILSKQLPNQEKVHRADFVIDTSHGKEAAQQQVEHILATIRQGLKNE
ncbi:dephospho-CoA kinase [Temperatibacter marinus]|uniref:Dephospho-CoA kinase n=1 Tax=Temperatibacter marinus TaxID=1456591 RepID=A0AA52EDV7_9PROT|nr:dephospho-CoA kinase [Temperatibacter marinus]WND03662.1 dephospho-CoA kinase [Temperatibacter marinus]